MGRKLTGDPALEYYKKNAKRTAKELHYSKEVLMDIQEATSEVQVDNILATARRRMRD